MPLEIGIRMIAHLACGSEFIVEKVKYRCWVPKLNRSELETACEDFSNIINTVEGSTVYKGILSTGVEIAIVSVYILSSKEWSKSLDKAYRRKIDTLSRVNHKNFVNLIGYCKEDAPFSRMMVFEYAPNGTIFEHLHLEETEHLDWGARMRIIMGVAYCLQYMHDDLNPPVAHSNLNSTNVFLTDDYAAKLAEIYMPPSIASKISGDGESEHSELPPIAEPEVSVYSFGILLLELISGKLPYTDEYGSLEKWADEYLIGRQKLSYMIDPLLKSFKINEFDVICEVINECIQVDPKQRATMKDIILKLNTVINIPPHQAIPRLFPLWWAEIEILSQEAPREQIKQWSSIHPSSWRAKHIVEFNPPGSSRIKYKKWSLIPYAYRKWEKADMDQIDLTTSVQHIIKASPPKRLPGSACISLP